MDVPKTEHFAVVYTKTIFIPGDERSRTHPGHGYPDDYESHQVYKAFRDQAELETWISRHRSEQYVVLKAQPLEVAAKVSYSFSHPC
jgi:hypothetical protein